MSPPVPDSPSPPDKPLPPPPALPFPTLLSLRELVQRSSDLDLDQRSWEHVRDLAKQSLKNVKEGEEVWLEPMLYMLHSLADYITASRIDLLSQSAIAEWKASDNSELQLASKLGGKGKEKEKEKGKAKEKENADKLKAPSVEEALLEKEKVLQLRRAGWMDARSLLALTHPVVTATITPSSSSSTLDFSSSAKDELPSLDTVESNVDPVAELEALDVPHEGDLSWTSISADLEAPPAILPKLTHFGMRLRVTETTVGAVAAGAVALGVQFEEGNWDGDGLFGRAFLEDPSDPNLELLGGALHLTCYHRETTKLSRILELLAFATLSLKLEAHLLRDASCARPLLLETTSEVDVDERDEGSGANTPTASQPVSVDGVDTLPSEEWSNEGKQGKGKSRWSKSSIWGILTGHTSLSESKDPLPRTKTATPSNPFPRSETLESMTSLSSVSRYKAPSILSFDSQAHPMTARNVKERFKERFSKRSRRVGSGSWGGPSVGSEYDGMGIENGWDFIGGLGIAVQASGSSVGRQQKTGLVSLREEDGRDKELPAQKIEKVSEPEVTDRFQIVIKAMEKCILSTSPDVIFPPPHLLVRLRQQELAQAALLPPQIPLDSGVSIKPLPFRPLPKSIQSSVGGRLRSYSTIDAQALAIGFASGKDGLAELGKENGSMSSTTSERVARIALDARAGLASLLTNNNSLAGAVRHQGIQFLVETVARDAAANQIPCIPPKWLVFDYYQQEDTLADTASSTTKDVSLGQLVERLVDSRDLPCEAAGCKKLRHDHCIYYMHSKERICISLSTIPTSDADPILPSPFKADPMKPRISLWTICQTCHATTPPQLLSTATLGISFAKYAEILLYDPDFVPLPDLCAHAVLERGALVRCFAIDRTVVSLRMDKIELFELRLPTSVNPDIESEAEACSKDTDAESADMLRHEIRSFYVSIRRRLDYLQDLLEELEPKPTTIKGINPTKLVAPGERPEHIRSSSEKTIVEGDAEEQSEEEDSAGTLKGSQQPLHLLVKLRKVFELDELDLLSSTNDLNAQRLNNGRWQFITKANNSKSRIAAWENKHFGDGKVPDDPIYSQPEYFAKEIHVFPCDSSLLVRELELSSLIALTLSAKNFQDELAGPSVVSSRSASAQGIFGFPLIDPPKRPLARAPIPVELLDAWNSPLPLSTNSSIRSTTPPRSPRPGFFSMRSAVLDADDFSVEMSPSEEMEYCAKVKKGGPPRIASSILSGGSSILSGSIRALSRQKSTDSFGFFRSPIVTPTEDADEKRFSRGPISDSVLEDLIATADIPPSPKPSAHLRAVPSVIATIGKRHASEPTTNLSTGEFFAHSTRSSETSSLHSMDSVPGTPELRATSPSAPGNDHDDKQDDVQHPMDPPERPSRLISGPLNALFSLPGSLRMRNGISSPKSLGSGSYNGASSSSAHIKFNFRHGEKEFRVTSYFAKRFQSLRTKCGLSETLFTESLSRCSDLNPSGGKSKAAFLMTGDRRFILKELVTAWNISERESFLTFAPALLDYLMAPEKPSLLAKIFGFYTVKTKNHKTGEVKKVDLVVMEHLFHSQTITRQFDLKGVASRVAKVKSGSGSGSSEAKVESSTGWDHDFLNGTLTTRLLIYSHSKTLLLDALRNDTQFLSEAGNIDYSLLVGVDDEKKELVVGLIDTLGVFNTLKMLENVGKTALKKATSSDTETVTILPPNDYASRFRQAMGKYFMAVPEKFSRPPGAILDPDPRLPSVL